jgi:hypothetical protein
MLLAGACYVTPIFLLYDQGVIKVLLCLAPQYLLSVVSVAFESL